MSDALSDIARDEARTEAFEGFLRSIVSFLTNDADLANVKKAAEKVDGIRGGFNTSQTNVSKDLEKVLAGLKAGDENVWARFITGTIDWPQFESLKALSPFKNKLLVPVGWTNSGISIERGDIHAYLEKILREMDRHECPKRYRIKSLMVLPMLSTNGCSIFCLDCGEKKERRRAQRSKNK